MLIVVPFPFLCGFVADTEGSFLPERALHIAEGTVAHMRSTFERQTLARAKKGGGGDSLPPLAPPPTALDLLRGIHVCRVFDSVEQLACIKSLPAFLRAHPKVHLLVFDSVAYHFRRGYANDMGLRARMLMGMAQELLQLANEFKLAVVVTNQVRGIETGRQKQQQALACYR
jgi:RAD51-like protein 2